MQLHDILQLRTSVILPEAISDGGLAPTTDTSLFLTTYRGGSHLPSDVYNISFTVLSNSYRNQCKIRDKILFLVQPFFQNFFSVYAAVCLANQTADGQQTSRRYGQLIDTHCQEQFCQITVCTKFTTDTTPDACFMCILNGLIDHTKYGDMMCIKEGIQ